MQFGQLTRRELIGAAAAAWPLVAQAQQPRKLPLVGVLVSASPPHPFAAAFERGLRALGYAEGQNIAVEFRYKGTVSLLAQFLSNRRGWGYRRAGATEEVLEHVRL